MAMSQLSVVTEKGRGLLTWVLAKLSPRVAGLICAALLALAFVFPLWRIELYAPQYPEGLTMYIWINHMAGEVSQVNLLNHYVGMKPIDALSIPELVLMPKILLGLIVLAVVAALPNRRWLLTSWYAVFVAVGAAGLWDFYSWEYDYGHNLNPHAPIQMAGMNYQPPLLGAKTLLNITAISLPDWGGIAIFLAAAIALLPLFQPFLSRQSLLNKVQVMGTLLGWVVVVCASSCTPMGPSDIHIGQDACDACRMTISDARFGGEIRLLKGKLLKFDSIECLTSYVRRNSSGIRNIYVENFFKPGHLIDVKDAVFTHISGTRGPMGSGWIAVADPAQLRQLGTAHPGTPLEAVRWKNIVSGAS